MTNTIYIVEGHCGEYSDRNTPRVWINGYAELESLVDMLGIDDGVNIPPAIWDVIKEQETNK